MPKINKLASPIFQLIGSILKTFNATVNIDGLRILFPKTMTTRERGFSILGIHEKHERKLVKKYISPSDSVLELGACLGVVSATINRILEDKIKQVSVEPNLGMVKYLEINKNKNNAEFSIENCIISKNDEVDFFSDDIAFLSSSSKGKGNSSKIKGVTIELLEQKYFKFTALVMDIEGGELDLLRTFDLTKTDIRKIIWETHGDGILTGEELEECYALLRRYNYEFVDNSKNVEYWKRN